MVSKNFKETNISFLKLKADGNTNIEINKSEDNNLNIEIEYDDSTFVVEGKLENNSFKLKIYDPNKNDTDLIKGFVNSLGSIKEMIGFIKDNQNHYFNKSIIKIWIPTYLDDIIIKQNNGLLIINYLHTKLLDIDGNNLKIKLSDDINIKFAKIKTNNSTIKIILNNTLETMNIKSNNSKLSFKKMENFFGGISCKGNNIKKKGEFDSDRNIIVKCQVNNSSISVKQVN